jgi:three-Cys-motif partner protein
MRRAEDGMPARESGRWTQDKLHYVERYAGAFTKAMSPKRTAGLWSELVYLDFLAGPGRGIDRESGREFEGSPLRALRVDPRFDRCFFSDLDPRCISALERRVPAADRLRVHLHVGDCHTVAEEVIAGLRRKSLGLAFVDPEGFEVTFSLFRTLATRRIDVLYLFPGGIGVNRNYRMFSRQAGAPLDDLIPGWRRLKRARLAAGEQLSPEDMASRDQPFVQAFMHQMAGLGFLYSEQGEPYLSNEKNAPMYHLLFFSQHPAGLKIWRGIKTVEPSGQRAFRF